MRINGQLLTEARRRGHVSLRAVGRTSGVTSFAVDRLEKIGDATNVAFGVLEAIAGASGLPLHDLVCGPGADPEDADVEAVLAALLGSPHGIVMDALTDARGRRSTNHTEANSHPRRRPRHHRPRRPQIGRQPEPPHEQPHPLRGTHRDRRADRAVRRCPVLAHARRVAARKLLLVERGRAAQRGGGPFRVVD